MAESESPRPPLPGFTQLALVAAYAVAPLIGLCLVFGLIPGAISVAAGYVISMAVAGVLYMLVEVSVKQLAGSVHGPKDGVGQSAATAKFAALLIGKFLGIGVVAYLVFQIPGIKAFGVALGFVIAQAAVIIYAARFSKG